jgi:hypothetical protein
MVIKSKKTSQKKRKLKLGKVNKETVKDLTASERKQVKGGDAGKLCRATATCGVHFPTVQG